jgi:hypothetical protein
MINGVCREFGPSWPRHETDRRDNIGDPERIRGGSLGREVGEVVMAKDGRSIGTGVRVLLVAAMIQGITPDDGDLASSWLLRFMARVSAGGRAADHGRMPPRRDDRGGAPGELCPPATLGAAAGVRHDAGGRTGGHFLPVGLLERPGRSASGPLAPTNRPRRGSRGLIPSLCRFRC